MFSSIKRFLQKGKDTTVSSSELLHDTKPEQPVEEGESVEEIYPQISFHPFMYIEDETRYVYQFMNNELPPLQPNQLSLSAIDIEEDEEGISVTAFVRNSLSKSVLLQDVVLLLLNEDRELLTKKEFILDDLGELPASSSRPWRFYFEREFLLTEELPKSGFQLAFDLTKNVHRLDLDPTWDAQLPEEQKEELNQIVASLPKLGQNEVNIHPLNAKVQDDGNLTVTIFLRNGSKQAINIETLPLEVINDNGELVARGSFNLPPLTVGPNSSKPWTFIFPSDLVVNPTFTRFTVRIPNQEVV